MSKILSKNKRGIASLAKRVTFPHTCPKCGAPIAIFMSRKKAKNLTHKKLVTAMVRRCINRECGHVVTLKKNGAGYVAA